MQSPNCWLKEMMTLDGNLDYGIIFSTACVRYEWLGRPVVPSMVT
jgi:hypothetical protein